MTTDSKPLELKNLEVFLASLQHHLIVLGAPEAAFIEAVNAHHKILPKSFMDASRKILVSGVPLFNAFEVLIREHPDTETSRILASLQRILSHSINDAIVEIQRFLYQIQHQRVLLNRRQVIQKTVQFKTKILLGLTSFLVGFLAGTTPFLILLVKMTSEGFNFLPIQLLITPLPPAAILFPICLQVYVHYRIAIRIGSIHRVLQVLFSTLFFAVGLLLSQSFFLLSFL